MCYIIEETFERVPVNEERQLDEGFKNRIEEIFEKKLLEAKANLVVSKGKKARKKSSKNIIQLSLNIILQATLSKALLFGIKIL